MDCVYIKENIKENIKELSSYYLSRLDAVSLHVQRQLLTMCDDVLEVQRFYSEFIGSSDPILQL